MRFAFVDEAQGVWPVAAVCRNLGVTPAGYYARKGRPASPRAAATATLAEGVKAAFAEGRGTFGSPRVYRALLARGVACCVNTVARRLRSLGLAACPRRRKPRPAGPGDGTHAATPNLLDRQFAATGPNEKWVSDITFIPTGEGWHYLAAVLDLSSRRVVGWAMGASADAALTTRALGMAVASRRPAAGLLVHSDRGCQYTSAEYRAAAGGHGVALSFSRRGNCWDNAPMESFFASLKKDLVFRESFATRAVAERSIFEYVEVFYNRVRLHSSLGYVAPATFESLQP